MIVLKEVKFLKLDFFVLCTIQFSGSIAGDFDNYQRNGFLVNENLESIYTRNSMEILLICVYAIFVTYDLVDSWKVLLATKRRIYIQIAFIATILLLVYIGFEIIPINRKNSLQVFFRSLYDSGYGLLIAYSVYDFVIWIIMSFSKSRDRKHIIETAQYGFRHTGFLLIGTCAACYLTVKGHYYLSSPVGVSLINIYWILIYSAFFIVVMIRMIWGKTVNFTSLVRVLFSCIMGLYLLFFIMFMVDNLLLIN